MNKSAFLAILSCCLLYGQSSSPSLQFEVATLKLVGPPKDGRPNCSGGPGTPDPGLYTCASITVSNLITLAFGLNPAYQLADADFGGPVRYAVMARVPAGATRDQFNVMLQHLLIERLKLKFHYEERLVMGYDLSVARGGPRMKVASPDEQLQFEGRPTPSGRRMTAHAIGVDWLVRQLTNQLGVPVTDSTGLKGAYDFVLNWTPDDGRVTTDVAPGPTLEDAVKDQLGLKLERKKVDVKVFVVDHVETKPIEN